MAAGSVISQFPPSIPIVFAVWGLLIIGGIIGTARAFNLQSPPQKQIWLFWAVLCMAVFIENALAAFVPAFSFLLPINFFFLWSVAIGFGYFYTAEKTKWGKLKMYGVLSILSSILFFIPVLLPYQAALFGIVQCGMFGYLAFGRS